MPDTTPQAQCYYRQIQWGKIRPCECRRRHLENRFYETSYTISEHHQKPKIQSFEIFRLLHKRTIPSSIA